MRYCTTSQILPATGILVIMPSRTIFFLGRMIMHAPPERHPTGRQGLAATCVPLAGFADRNAACTNPDAAEALGEFLVPPGGRDRGPGLSRPGEWLRGGGRS